MIREQVKSLWKLCFDDSEAFIELYFRLRYNNEVNLAIQSGEEVIAALQMLLIHTFCGSNRAYFIHIRRMHSSRLSKQRSDARTTVTKFCTYAPQRCPV